jgi:hypothetical protein
MPQKINTEISGKKLAVNAPEVEEINFAGSKNDWLLFKIASWSTALCLGASAASLASLYKSEDGFAFRISAGTFVAFALGATAGFLYWKLVSRRSVLKTSSFPKAASILLLLAGIGMFLYPMRFVATEKLTDAFVGITAGAFALSLVALILLRIKRALDEDTAHADTSLDLQAELKKTL